MRIVFYCQHVLGMGHLFRSLEIARALAPHEVHLVTGGPEAPLDLPDNVVHRPIRGLRMDEEFCTVYADDPTCCMEDVQAERLRDLLQIMTETRPRALLVELFPFGRKLFACELVPLLQHVKSKLFGHCAAVCSVRDILVEKRNQAKYEQRVLDWLNPYFQGVLVHADPQLVRFEETFSRVADMAPPLRYTGYVAGAPSPGARERVRAELDLPPDGPLIVASAGGGAVGVELLEATLEGSRQLAQTTPHQLRVFSGPYLNDDRFESVRRAAAAHQTVERFCARFPDMLAAADLSVSMAGYNTTMNLLAARTFGLVLPFDQNREQRMRAERLQDRGALRVLDHDDLVAERMASLLAEGLRARPADHGVDLDGARKSSEALLQLVGDGDAQ